MHNAALTLLYVYLVDGAFDKKHQEKQICKRCVDAARGTMEKT